MRPSFRFERAAALALSLTAALAGCASVSTEARHAEVSPVVPATTPPAPARQPVRRRAPLRQPRLHPRGRGLVAAHPERPRC